MSFSERVEKLDREIGATVERALGALRRELAERLRAGNEQILRAIDEIKPELPSRLLGDEHVAPFAQEATGAARQGAFAELRDAAAAIDAARSQAAILAALLEGGRRFASRTAVLIARGGRVQGWGAQGFGDGQSAIREVAIDPAGDGGWGQLARGEGTVRLSAAECAELCSRLESPLPHEGVVVPIVLRDQLAAALYADRLDGADLTIEGLQTLAYIASQAIESLPFRERAATATLRLAEAGPATAAAAPSAPPAAPEPETTTAAQAAPEAPAAEPAEEDQAAVAAEAPNASVAAPVAAEEAGEDTAATAASASAPAPAGLAAPASAESEPAAAIGWGSTQEVAHPFQPAPPPAPVEPPASAAPASVSAGAETVLLPRVAFTEPAAAPTAPPAPGPAADLDDTQAGAAAPPLAPEPRAAASPIGSPEVRPPSGVEGPGWAFNTTRVSVAQDDEALHEEARRLARLLVSEIKLYNEEQVEEGRRNRDLYERLKEDIDRSRQMYEERVEPRVLRATDYFYQELVRILAAGDSKALGI